MSYLWWPRGLKFWLFLELWDFTMILLNYSSSFLWTSRNYFKTSHIFFKYFSFLFFKHFSFFFKLFSFFISNSSQLPNIFHFLLISENYLKASQFLIKTFPGISYSNHTLNICIKYKSCYAIMEDSSRSVDIIRHYFSNELTNLEITMATT